MKTAGNRDRRIIAALVLIGVTAAVGTGCVKPRSRVGQIQAPPQVLQSQLRFRKEYVLVGGDQIDVVVRGVPDVSRLYTIRPDGYISVPRLDDVVAAGLTPQELDARLTELLAKRLVDPEVTVIAAQVRQPTVYVTGDVANHAAVPLRNAATAMQAITYAGGFRRSASIRDVTIIRLSEDGVLRALPIDVTVDGQSGPLLALQTSMLQPDDIVFVPENGRSQVARFFEDVINRPLNGLNSILGVYVNFRIVQEFTR